MPDINFIKLSSDAFSDRDRFEAIREIYGRAIMRLDFEPVPGAPFNMDMTLRALPDLGISSGSCTPVRCLRSVALADSEDLILVVALTGGGVLQWRGNEVPIQAGEAMLTSSVDPGTFHIHTNSRFVNFRLTFNRIVPLVRNLKLALYRPIPAETEALRLLLNYVGGLQDETTLASPEVRNLVVAHIHDLVALTIGATLESAEIARGRGVRAARLRAAKLDIMENLNHHDLSISAVAARHGITPRYVRMLFETEGTNFSDFVLRQRLDRAHRMLADPRFSARTISSIALEAGFNDLSYFNRTFRRTYGATPSDVRAMALR